MQDDHAEGEEAHGEEHEVEHRSDKVAPSTARLWVPEIRPCALTWGNAGRS